MSIFSLCPTVRFLFFFAIRQVLKESKTINNKHHVSMILLFLNFVSKKLNLKKNVKKRFYILHYFTFYEFHKFSDLKCPLN